MLFFTVRLRDTAETVWVVTRYVGSGIRSPKLGIKAVRSCRDQRQNPEINTSLDLSREDLKF